MDQCQHVERRERVIRTPSGMLMAVQECCSCGDQQVGAHHYAGKPPHEKPFGWDVEVEFHPSSGKPPETFHWRGCSERAARLKGMMKRNAQRILKVTPVTERQWIAAYGIGRS